MVLSILSSIMFGTEIVVNAVFVLPCVSFPVYLVVNGLLLMVYLLIAKPLEGTAMASLANIIRGLGGGIALVLAIVFAVIAVWAFLEAGEGRANDKETFSYNILWGAGSLALLLLACAALTIKTRLGL